MLENRILIIKRWRIRRDYINSLYNIKNVHGQFSFELLKMCVSLVNAFRVQVNPCNEMTLHGLREHF